MSDYLDFCATIKLGQLQHEWANFSDHSSQAWIGDKQAERDAAGRPPLDRDECEWWRRHFRSTREEFVRLSALPWQEVFMWVVHQDGPQRNAQNPIWIAANLRLLDTRPYAYTHLEKDIGVAQGHTYRTFDRGGVTWKAEVEGNRFAREQQEVSFDLRHFPSPTHGYVLSRGKVIRTDDQDVMRLPEDLRPTLPRPPRTRDIGRWYGARKGVPDTRQTRDTLDKRLAGLSAGLDEDHLERLSNMAFDSGWWKA